MARLTEQEQQEVTRYIEAGKPLPDKYRFLLFDDKREVELVWNGKSNEVCNIVLPFQTIELVDEPREESDSKIQKSLFDIDGRGRQIQGWTNKLIWGDNKLILSSLKNGPLRDKIEEQGGIKLIYIDPPFDVGADFSYTIEIGDEPLTKKPSIIEEIAYRDTWGKGADSYVQMMYERLHLMHDLLADDGVIFLHCDWRVNSLLRCILDEVFSANCFGNQIIWKRQSAHSGTKQCGMIHDVIYFYHKGDNWKWNVQYQEPSADYIEQFFDQVDKDSGRRYARGDLTGAGITKDGESGRPWRGINPSAKGRHWAASHKELDRLDSEGRIHWPKKGVPRLKRFEDEFKGVELQDVWTDIKLIHNQSTERVGYATQKPESLLERIIKSCTDPNDLVADFFCGSGTLAAAAEKLGRKWIVSDLGKFAVHTTRKRLIGTQRKLKNDGKSFRAFEILNLGKYERQLFVGVNSDLREEEKANQLANKESAFIDLILNAYKAEKINGFKVFQGKKSGRLIAVGPVNLPVSRLFVDEVISECRQKRITKADILGFEFEMGLFPDSLNEAKKKGIDISPKFIPADVFDKRAIEKGQVHFHDVAYIEAKLNIKSGSVAVELKDFSVFYNQDASVDVIDGLKNKSSKVVVEKGQIVKVSKDAKGLVKRETLTSKWEDWVDYWSVDFNYGSKKEIVRVKKEGTDEWEDVWTGDFIFENEWQSFRTKQDRAIDLCSPLHELASVNQKIAVKVVDIFGNDTMTVLDIPIKGKK